MEETPPGRWWTIANGVRCDSRDRERLAQLIYGAVTDEREACAKYAEDLLTHYIDKPPTPSEVANALRNGSNPY